MHRPPPTSTLFPYTTLFRSRPRLNLRAAEHRPAARIVGNGDARAAAIGELRRDDVRAQRERSEEHTSELQSLTNLVCRLLLEKKKRSFRRSPRGTARLARRH